MRSFIALFALANIATADAQTYSVGSDSFPVVVKDQAVVDPAPKAGDCPDGFMPLPECGVTTTKTCVKVGSPLKYVSWLHMQYQCDVAGGYLPEPTTTRQAPLELILKSYEQLFGPTTLYVGATDITTDGTWKWLSGGTAIDSDITDSLQSLEGLKDSVSADGNKDCLTQDSESLMWKNVNCEENSAEIQIANICFANAEA